MTRRLPDNRRNGRGAEGGFTLIELLVVIIILGVLAAVVVFAVRGTDDKGRAAAVATDSRTIRTALETYCATKGHYPVDPPLVDGVDRDPMDVLVDERFLSSRSQYHALGTGDPPAFAQGNCPGRPTRYNLTCLDGSTPPNCGTGDDDPGDLGPPVPGDPPGPGSFLPTTPPPFDPIVESARALVAMPDGRVYAQTRQSVAIYDPATEAWTPVDPPPGCCDDGIILLDQAVLVADDPLTPKNDCGIDCGKVLVHQSFDFYLFDPAKIEGGAWEQLPSVPENGTPYGLTAMIPLRDNPETPAYVECGAHCGKILMTADESGGTTKALLYDPSARTVPNATVFTLVDYPLGREDEIRSLQSLTRLRDGRVLLAGRPGGTFPNWTAVIFDPRDLSFTDAATPPSLVDPSSIRSALLPNGEVMFNTTQGDGIVFYVPDRRGGGDGEWRSGPPCAEAGLRCRLFASLPGGPVLARSGSPVPTRTTLIFDPWAKQWKPAADLISDTSTYVHAFLDPATGGCGGNCGKLLLVGTTAELFTPSIAQPSI